MPKVVKIITATVCVVLGLTSVALIWVRDSNRNPEFCGRCHAGTVSAHYSSWESSDYLAHAHAQAAVTCQDCHPTTVTESISKILASVTRESAVALQGVEVQAEHSNEECFACHGSYEETVQRTAYMAANPHDSHLIGEQLDCVACHKIHEPSQDYCAECHGPMSDEPGWTTEVTSIANLGLSVFEPDMDCTVCHLMAPYVESMENTSREAYAHAQEGLKCLDCHELEAITQVHQQAKPTERIRPRSVTMDQCFFCHTDNEHTSYEQVIARTEGYTIRGEALNPHAITEDPANPADPHSSGEGQVECSNCHKMHKASPGVEYCYHCHHERNFDEGCTGTGCHESGGEPAAEDEE
ncbi:MAG: hypothetical protein EHM56_00110 [Chloroflexi bacterium]|nr:MAG: hypothetical protein EHM56_00110 [Chloroflexota bacterium]